MAMASGTPAVSASDGPRTQVQSMPSHQAKAYGKLRKKGFPHATAMKFAKRIKSKANSGGTASYTRPAGQMLNLATTQTSALPPQSAGKASWPNNKGVKVSGPPLTVSKKATTPKNLDVKGASSTYRKMRARGLDHGTSMRIAKRANTLGGTARKPLVTAGPNVRASE